MLSRRLSRRLFEPARGIIDSCLVYTVQAHGIGSRKVEVGDWAEWRKNCQRAVPSALVEGMVVPSIRNPDCLEIITRQGCVVFSCCGVWDREHVEINGVIGCTVVEGIMADIERGGHHLMGTLMPKAAMKALLYARRVMPFPLWLVNSLTSVCQIHDIWEEHAEWSALKWFARVSVPGHGARTVHASQRLAIEP